MKDRAFFNFKTSQERLLYIESSKHRAALDKSVVRFQNYFSSSLNGAIELCSGLRSKNFVPIQTVTTFFVTAVDQISVKQEITSIWCHKGEWSQHRPKLLFARGARSEVKKFVPSVSATYRFPGNLIVLLPM